MDSIELKVVEKCTAFLETALNKSERSFVHFLREKGFINVDTADKILNPEGRLNDNQKARELVQGINNRIKLHKMSYYILLEEFKNRGAFYEPIAEKLDKEYIRQSAESQIGQCWNVDNQCIGLI